VAVLVTLGLVILAGWYLHTSRDEDPLEIARRRLAKGDITQAEFDAIQKRIERKEIQ
jgi:uncharacterized membrane protein